MLAGSHRNAWPDETGTGGRTNRNTHLILPEQIALPVSLAQTLVQVYFLALSSATDRV